MLALGVLAVGLALAQQVTGVDTAMLAMSPAIALFLPLLSGRYVGEETLHRWKAAFVPRRPRAVAALLARLPRRPHAAAPGARGRFAPAVSRRGPPRAGLVVA